FTDHFFSYGSAARPHPPSFPTRRSSDLDTTYLEDKAVLIARDGARRDIRASAAPLRTPAGEMIGSVLAFQDITNSRSLQRQLARSEEHTSELQSRENLVCRLLLEKKKSL